MQNPLLVIARNEAILFRLAISKKFWHDFFVPLFEGCPKGGVVFLKFWHDFFIAPLRKELPRSG